MRFFFNFVRRFECDGFDLEEKTMQPRVPGADELKQINELFSTVLQNVEVISSILNEVCFVSNTII